MTVQVTIEARDLERAGRELRQRRVEPLLGETAAAVMDSSGDVLEANIRRAARPHRATGGMERRIRARGRGEGIRRRVTVRAGGRVAPLVAGGTAPHVIRPVQARALAFVSRTGGVAGFAGAVRHPGQAADPFFRRGVARSDSQLHTIRDHAADDLAAELADRIEGRP